MKIVLIALAGDKDYFTLLGQQLNKEHNVTIICPQNLINSNFDIKANIVILKGNAGSNGLTIESFLPSFSQSLIKTIAKIKPEVIHVYCETRFPFPLMYFLHNIAPTILTIHEARPFFSPSPLRHYLINPLININNKMLIRYSDIVLVHGSNHKSILVNNLRISSEKIQTVPLAALDHFKKWANDTETVEDSVLYLGRIWPYKGIQYFLKSALIIQEIKPDVKFVIAGQGNFSAYESLADKVKRLLLINRYLSDEEIAHLIQGASLVVLPYIAGSQTGWISAAYCFKKPVVATETGNFSEMVQNNKTGLIVPPCDAEALAKAIIRLINNPDLRLIFGANGQRLMGNEMSWKSIAIKTLNVYKQTIEKRKRFNEDNSKQRVIN